MSKYGWDDDELPVEQLSKDIGRMKVHGQDDVTAPSRHSIDFEEVIQAPAESINAQMKVLKEREALVEKIEEKESSNEGLKEVYRHMLAMGKVSRETRSTLLSLESSLSLESAGEYTSVPSDMQFDETEKAVIATIARNEMELGEGKAKNYVESSLALFSVSHDDREMSGKDKASDLCELRYVAHYQRTKYIHQYNRRLLSLIDQLHDGILEERRTAVKDYADARRLGDDELIMATESHARALIGVSESTGTVISSLLSRVPSSFLDKYKESMEALTPNTLHVASDFITEEQEVISKLFSRTSDSHAFTESLDTCGEALCELVNNIGEENDVSELYARFIDAKEEYERHVIVDDGFNLEETGLESQVVFGLEDLVKGLLHADVDTFYTELMRQSNECASDIDGLKRYSELYNKVLEIITGLSGQGMTPRGFDTWDKLVSEVHSIIGTLGASVYYRCKVHAAVRAYEQGVLFAYRMMYDLLSHAGAIEYGNLKSNGQDVSDILNEIAKTCRVALDQLR